MVAEIFWNPEKYLEFLPYLIRTSVFVLAVPMFTAGIIPVFLRAGIGFAIAIAVYSGAGSESIAYISDLTPADIVAGVISELVLAFLIFLIIRIFFLGPQLAGEVMGFQLGYGLQTIAQPFAEVPLSILGDIFFLSAMVIFFLLDLHIGFVWGIKKSFELVPPFAMIKPWEAGDIMLQRLSESFTVALQVSLPLLIAMFVVEVGIAIVSRSIPQFNIFVVGFPIRIILGLLVLTFTFDRMAFWIGEFMRKFIEDFSDILKLVF